MMLRPAMTEILRGNQSYYSLVVAVAKRARDIAVDADIKGIRLEEKPVKIAVAEFANRECTFIESRMIGEVNE